VAHFYHLPVNVYGFSTNAHLFDVQNGFERAMNAVLPVLAGADEISGIGEMEAGGMGHACELETSLMLHLRPDLVHMERAVDEVDFVATPSYYMDWVESGALIANPPWEDDTRTGAYGAGSLGTAHKGAVWLQAAIDEKIGHVGEIQEQYRRRMQKRGLY
jgi:creatinine amidohydrolase/Fe(II)-dependent formamide hydrolase-like protein